MFTLGNRNQLTVYVSSDVEQSLLEFADAYPIASASDIVNASLRYYLPLALKGCDGRLRPLETPNTKTIEEILKGYLDQRRVVWTDHQREEFKRHLGGKENGAPKSPAESH